jgi:hypothetical protein
MAHSSVIGVVLGCNKPVREEGCVRCPDCDKHHPGATSKPYPPTCMNPTCSNFGKSLYRVQEAVQA